jgi:pimeloyl-ACP methyl ester carboxylesterase
MGSVTGDIEAIDGGRATRLDQRAGIREEASFFGADHARIFGVLHAPVGGVLGGVVVCPPLYAEFVRNYRREVLLARAFASCGVAVQRFHHRGTGNSEGDPADHTFEAYVDDAMTAVAELRARADVDRIGILGTRWGGVVAMAAAARSGDGPVVLWEPVIDPSRYLREVFRGRSISDLKSAARGGAVAGDPLEELRANGVVDILGYEFHRALYESAQGHPLEGELGSRQRPVLIVQLGDGRGTGRDASALIGRLRSIGCAVEHRWVPGREAWWFGGELAQREEERVWAASLVSLTTAWFARTLEEER